jgi:putative oxidoreductase
MNPATPPPNPWYRRLLRPISADTSTLILRLFFGASLAFAHGHGKVFGNTDKFISGVEGMDLPFPVFFGWAAALSEYVGGICLALGLGTRVFAFFIAITMIVAGFVRHAADPFGVKELAFAYLAAMIAIFLIGPGRFSLDHLIFRRRAS